MAYSEDKDPLGLTNLDAFADNTVIVAQKNGETTAKGGLWSLVKSTLKTYFDTIYATAAQGSTADTAMQPGDDAADLGAGASADGYVLTSDGAGGAAWEAAAGGGGSPGGSDTQVQFNDGGAYGGDADYTYDKIGNILTVPTVRASTGGGVFVHNLADMTTNYERGFMRWNSNVLEIGAEKGGTGTQRGIHLNAGSHGIGLFTGMGGIFGSYNKDVRHGISLDQNIGIILNASTVYGSASAVWFGSGLNTTTAAVTSSASITFGPITTGDAVLTHYCKPARKNSTQSSLGNGHHMVVSGGEGSTAGTGNNDGGNLILRGGSKTGTGVGGYVIADTLPTSSAGLPTGAIWNDAGTLKIA